MKKVDIVFSSYLNSIVGPVQTLKRLIGSYSFFKENDYDLTLFTLENPIGTKVIPQVQSLTVEKRSRSLIIKKIKELFRFLAQHSFVYDALRIMLLFVTPSKHIKNYRNQNRRPNVIVFHSLFDCYCYLKQQKNIGPKIVLFIHADSAKSSMLYEYFPKAKGTIVEKKINSITEFVMNRVDRVVSISKIGAQNFCHEYPQLNGRIEVVVNGINDISREQLSFVKESRNETYLHKYRLISCGSINGRKGQWIVIDALTKLPAELRSEIEYTVVGDGPQRITLEEKAKKYGLNVSFVGSVPNVDVYKYLAKSNIAILMSSNEGLPLSLLEALRCGLAGISTKVAAIPEVIVDGYNGVLINPDVVELYNLLIHISDYQWSAMGHRSRELFEKEYTFERMRKDYLSMLKSL